jgi:hypothetical protein
MGMTTLEALMLIRRRPSASPCRCGGVIWCKVLMIMGCTVPSTNPNNTEHTPMARALGIKGYTANNKPVHTMAVVMI